VPWKRLGKQYLIFGALALAALFIIGRSNFGPSTVVTVIVAGGVYVALGALMVKFGWTPPSLMSKEEIAAAREARASQQAARRAAKSSRGAKPSTGSSVQAGPPPKAKPAPTKRTSGGTRPSPKRRP
jgi:hypothetical protein